MLDLQSSKKDYKNVVLGQILISHPGIRIVSRACRSTRHARHVSRHFVDFEATRNEPLLKSITNSQLRTAAIFFYRHSGPPEITSGVSTRNPANQMLSGCPLSRA